MLRLVTHTLLSSARLFELQQRLCNDYSAVRTEFAPYLAGSRMRILDVGCSTGAAAGFLFDMSFHSYHGIDADAAYVRRARRLHPAGRWCAMDARCMGFLSGQFDLAVYVGVLHHMSDDVAVDCLRETRRVLKDGSYLLVAEPVFTPGRRLSSWLLGMDRGRHIRDSNGYRALLEGYVMERERYFGFSVHRFCSFVLRKDGRGRPPAPGAPGPASR